MVGKLSIMPKICVLAVGQPHKHRQPSHALTFTSNSLT